MKTNLRSKLRCLSTASGVALGLLFSQAHLYGGWQPPVIVSDPTIPVDQQAPSVMSVNPQGNAIAIWGQVGKFSTGSFDNMASSFYTNGSWDTPFILSNPTIDSSPNHDRNPSIAMNASNYAVAVWESEDQTNINLPFVVLARSRSPAGVWGPIQTLYEDPNGILEAILINVAVNDAGTALAAWKFYDANVNRDALSVSFSSNGGPWTAPFTFPLVGHFNALCKPTPSINASGDAVVAWRNNIFGGGKAIYAATYKASTGTWSSLITLNSLGAFDQASTTAHCAMAPNGTAVAIWNAQNEVRASYFDGTTWAPFVTINPNVSVDNFPTAVVVDEMGNFTAVWEQSDAGTVMSSTLPVGGTWSAPVDIASGDGFFDTGMSRNVLADPNGDVIAIFESNTLNNALYSAFKPFGQPWQPRELVFEGDFQVVNENIGLGSCGFAIALWNSVIDPFSSPRLIQVKAAINGNLSSSPFLKNVRGNQCCDSFATQKRCLNILKWGSDPCAKSYNIYRDGVLIANVPNDPPNKFVDTICKKEKHSYVVAAVSTFGFEMAPIPVEFE